MIIFAGAMKRHIFIYTLIAAIFCLLPDFIASDNENHNNNFSSEIIYAEQTCTAVSASDSDLCIPRPTNYSAPVRSNSQAKRITNENIQPLVMTIGGKHTCLNNFISYLNSHISCISGILRPEKFFICLNKLII